MELIQQNIDFLFYGVQQDWQAALLKQVQYWPQIASLRASVTRQEVYAWLDRSPRLKEWFDERQVQNLSARFTQIQNRDFESTIELDRNVIADDQFGLFAPGIQMLAQQAAMWPDQLVVAAMQNGALSTSTCYDGQPFFSASHPIDPDNSTVGTQSNLYTPAGSGSNPLNSQNFQAVRAALIAWKARDTRPVLTVPDQLVVPPLLETAGRQILQATFTAPAVAAGQNAANVMQSNVLTGMANLLVFPYLAGQDTTWYLEDTKTIGSVVKPIIFQQRQAPTTTLKMAQTDDNMFKRRKILFGVDARGNTGYSFPFLMAQASL